MQPSKLSQLYSAPVSTGSPSGRGCVGWVQAGVTKAFESGQTVGGVSLA